MILVTGGSGLVGAEVIDQLLKSGNKVSAVFNESQLGEFNNKDISIIPCDILDVNGLEEAMQGIHQVYHCAAIVSYNPKERKRLFDINVTGTANVVNAAIAAGVEKMVHVSSIAALGNAKKDEYVTEEINWNEKTGGTFYGRSKYFGEMEVWRGAAEGLNVVIVNPSTILGAGNWNKGSTAIFKTAYDEFKWYSEGTTGFVDAKDVARAMILLMNSEITNERFILNSENTSYKNVFTEIAKCFGKQVPVKKVTPFLASLVWRWKALTAIFSGQNPLVTRETTHTALSYSKYDNSKILKALPGFHFLPINETIKNTCATLKEKYHL